MHILSFFLVFIHDFVTLILPTSHLQTQQLATSQIRSHRIFNTNLQHTCAHFIIKINEKCSRAGGF